MIGLEQRYTSNFAPLMLGKTARDTLQEFIDIDVTADDLVRILNYNQTYRNLFSRFVQQRSAKQTDSKDGSSPTHRLIGLLGMIGSRNLILSLRMHKVSEGKFPISEDGKVDLKTSDYLKQSLEIEETFLRNKLEYSETAFAAGVYYDWIFHASKKYTSFKKLEPYFNDVWKRALKTGYLAYFLAEKIPGLSPKTAVAAGILSQLGKIHMALYFPEGKDSFPTFDESCKEAKISGPSKLILERAKFGFSQEELGAYSLFYFDVFADLFNAVRAHREPYTLKGADKNNYLLATTISLADAMAESWKIPADEKDPVFQEWNTASVKNLKLRSSILIDVMKRAMTLR